MSIRRRWIGSEWAFGYFIGESGGTGSFSKREKAGMREIRSIVPPMVDSPSRFVGLSTCLNPLPKERTFLTYLIEREKVQATVLVKPSRARAIVSSFWIMKLGWSTRNTLVPTVATAEWRDLG
jgi:hypothetical protein